MGYKGASGKAWIFIDESTNLQATLDGGCCHWDTAALAPVFATILGWQFSRYLTIAERLAAWLGRLWDYSLKAILLGCYLPRCGLRCFSAAGGTLDGESLGIQSACRMLQVIA